MAEQNEQTKDFWVVRDGQCRLEVRWLPPVGSALGMFLLPMEAGYLNMHQVSAVLTDDRGCSLLCCVATWMLFAGAMPRVSSKLT